MTKSRTAELSILALGASLLAPYAIAQDQGATTAAGDQSTARSDDDLTEIIVTGMRKAFATSQDIKKEADTVVDSITATDIGAFPDKSVAEALQRMTGITVTRFAASGDTTHFSAEPSGVVIRGLPQVRSEFNGRDSFNANSSRGLSFGDVSPELMAGVDTYKNATADMIEGGIAGTVNLRTHVPFDSEGFVAAFSGEIGYGDLSSDAKPSGSMLFSNRWDSGIGELGLMGNVAYSAVTTESQGLQLNRFFNVQGAAEYGGGQKWVPGGIDIRDNVYERERIGLSAAFQWKSPNEAWTGTLQFNRSRYQNDWEEYSLNAGVGPDAGGAQSAQDRVLTSAFTRPAVGTPAFSFDSNGVFQSGVLNDSVNTWAGPQSAQMHHPNGYNLGGYNNWYCYTWSGVSCPSTRGIGLGADTRYSTQTNVTRDISANLRWNVNDRLGLNFDLQDIDAKVHNFDNSMNTKSATDLWLDITGDKPRFEFRMPTGFGMTAGGYSDPRNYYHEWTMEHTEHSTGEERAYRVDADIKIEKGWLDSLRIGVRKAERDQDINWSTYNWGSVQPLWGVQPDQAFYLTQGVWNNTWTTKNLGPDLLGGGVFGGGDFIHPDFNLVRDYDATIAQFGGVRSNTWIPLAARQNCPGIEGLYCPVERQQVTEDTEAAYVMLKFGGDDTKWGNVSVRGNIGVRFVKTEVGALGGVAYPLWQDPGPPPPPVPGQPPTLNLLTLTPQADRDFMNGGSLLQTGGDNHNNVLPSLNVRFGFTDEQFLRFAASRAMARPDMGLYKNYVGVSLTQPNCTNGTVTYSVPGDCTSTPLAYTPRYTANAGNPGLPSTTADQLDLTYEWYFSSTGSLTTAVFYKSFNDYIQYGNYVRTFTNNNVTRDVTINGPITGDGASLKGIEVAYQQFFDGLPAPWNGLGVQANVTLVDNQGITNANLSTVSGGGTTQQDPFITFTDLPLEGFSDKSYNLVLMYEQAKYSGRLAWNWRSEYLVSQSDCCIKLPIWQEAYGQLDASFHYKPKEGWDIFLDAQNVLQAETVLKQQVTNDGLLLPRSWFINDRRLQLGVRYRIQ